MNRIINVTVPMKLFRRARRNWLATCRRSRSSNGTSATRFRRGVGYRTFLAAPTKKIIGGSPVHLKGHRLIRDDRPVQVRRIERARGEDLAGHVVRAVVDIIYLIGQTGFHVG